MQIASRETLQVNMYNDDIVHEYNKAVEDSYCDMVRLTSLAGMSNG